MASIQKRTLQNGAVRWIAQIRKKGYKTVNITKKTKAAVMTAAREVELAIDNGTWDEFAAEQKKLGSTTLEHFIKLYLEEVSPFKKGGKKTLANETTTLNLVLNSQLAKMDIYRIKTGHIIELRNQWRAKGNVETTINRKLTTLQDVFTHIRKSWRHEQISNPVSEAKMKVPTGTGRRSRVLTSEELTQLRKALRRCQSPYIGWVF